MKDLQSLIDVVETWEVHRQAGRAFNTRDMRRFIETMNDRTRHMISIIGMNSPEFYSSLQELAQHACTMTTPGAKVYGDGIDRTNV